MAINVLINWRLYCAHNGGLGSSASLALIMPPGPGFYMGIQDRPDAGVLEAMKTLAANADAIDETTFVYDCLWIPLDASRRTYIQASGNNVWVIEGAVVGYIEHNEIEAASINWAP
jgi:hypothetical protein